MSNMLRYFPLRFILCNLFYSFLYLYFIEYVQSFEFNIISFILDSMNLLIEAKDNILIIGTVWLPTEISLVSHIYGIYIVVLLSLLTASNTSLKRRITILVFLLLLFITFIILEVLSILVLLSLNMLSSTSLTQLDIVLSAFAAALITELMFYRILPLPKRVKVKQVLKKNRLYEYLKFTMILTNSIIAIYILMSIFNIEKDTPLTAYTVISMSSVLIYTNFIGFLLRETSIPKWSTINKNYEPTISFIIPAYNEENFIERCITSIDKAASNYKGTTEIIVVDDGSTDNTPYIIDNLIKNLRYAKGVAIHIPNSGKGYALNVGLKNAKGEIVFRIDADSRVDEHVIPFIVRHFRDPEVGSVSGIIYGIESKYIWQKFLIATLGDYIFTRRSQEYFDTIMVQPGAFSVFRRNVIEMLGGWGSNTFGEDRDLTFRIGRLGYKNEFDDNALIYSDIPRTLKELRKQRVRWNIGFYFSHARNLDILNERLGARTIIFAYELVNHGSALALFTFWNYLAVSLLLGFEQSISTSNIFAFLGFPAALILIDLIISAIQYTIYIYFLVKHKFYNLIKYVLLLKIYQFTLMFFFVEATNLLLSTEKSDDPFNAIRTKIRQL